MVENKFKNEYMKLMDQIKLTSEAEEQILLRVKTALEHSAETNPDDTFCDTPGCKTFAQGGRKGFKGVRTAIIVSVALVFILGTAFALNPSLYHSFISVFRLEEKEILFRPESADGETVAVLESKVLENKVRVDVLSLPERYWLSSNGVIRTFQDETMNDSDYYVLRGGEVVELVPEKVNWQGECFGDTVNLSFDWFIYEEQLHVFPYYETEQAPPATSVNVRAVKGATDGVLLFYSTRNNGERESYITCLSLAPLEEIDIFMECGVEKVGPIADFSVTPDLKRALLVQWTEDYEAHGIGSYYYVDLEKKTTVLLDELIDYPLSQLGKLRSARPGCPPVRDEVPFAMLLDDGSVSYGLFRNGKVSIWRWDKSSGKSEVLLDKSWDLSHVTEALDVELKQEPILRPAVLAMMGQFSILLDQNDLLWILDQGSGRRYAIEDFIHWDEWKLYPNLQGTKILFTTDGEKGKHSSHIMSVGVLDLKKGSFTSFDRDAGEPGIFYNESEIDWFDEDRAAVIGLYGNDDEYQRYLSVYEFMEDIES